MKIRQLREIELGLASFEPYKQISAKVGVTYKDIEKYARRIGYNRKKVNFLRRMVHAQNMLLLVRKTQRSV